MELKKQAVAGSLNRGDVQILVRPNPEGGIQISLESKVKLLFGDAIEATVRKVLEEFSILNAVVEISDQEALDFAIRARMECAVCRSAEIRYDWGREDRDG